MAQRSLNKPPQNIEAEQSLLSSMLIDPGCISEVRRIVSAVDFYRPAHQEIFSAICGLQEEGKPVEFQVLQDELANRGKLKDTDAAAYIWTILNKEYSSKNAASYADIVRSKALRRQALMAAEEAKKVAYDEELEEDEFFAGIIRPFLDIHKIRSGRITTMADAAFEALTTLGQNIDAGGIKIRSRFGIGTIDDVTLGIPKGLTIIGGRPSEGKSALMLQMLSASRQYGPFILFPLEMDEESLAYRMFASGTGTNLMDIRKGDMEGAQFDRINEYATRELYQLDNVFISQSTNISDILSDVQMLRLEHDIQGVFVDYLQLVDGPGDGETEKCVYVMNKLKLLSKQVRVVLGAQLNRDVDKAGRKENAKRRRPRLSDLKQTGKIEEHADLAILIHNPKPQNLNDAGGNREAELLIAKQRNGITASVPVMWNGSKQKFYEIQDDLPEPPYQKKED